MTKITKVEKFSAHTNVDISREETDLLMDEIQSELDGVKWLLEMGISEEMLFDDNQVEWYVQLNNQEEI